MTEPAELAREVSAILGREVKGVRTKDGGIILSVPGHSLQISPGVPVDPAGCARELMRVDKIGNLRIVNREAISAALTKAYDNIITEAPEDLTRLLDALK